MAMRVSGINSGLDTDSIVQELVSAYNTKTEKYQKEQTKLSWKQEIWKGLNTKVYSLYNNVGKLRFSSAYSTKRQHHPIQLKQLYLQAAMRLMEHRNCMCWPLRSLVTLPVASFLYVKK